MFSFKKVLTKYFYFISSAFGLIDFTYIEEKEKAEIHPFLKVYSKTFSFFLILILPLQTKFLFSYLFRSSLHPEIISIVWGLEYSSLLILAITLYSTVNFNRHEMRQLINEGISILKSSIGDELTEYERKMSMILFIKTFFIDNFIICYSLLSNMFSVFVEPNARLATIISYVLNFHSAFAFNAFIYFLLLMKFEFDKINNGVEQSIMHDEHLEFLKNVIKYKRLSSYCKRIMSIFAKCCLANFVYSVATTCSGVR